MRAMRRRCTALTDAGRPCRAFRLPGQRRCVAHDPFHHAAPLWGGPADGQSVVPRCGGYENYLVWAVPNREDPDGPPVLVVTWDDAVLRLPIVGAYVLRLSQRASWGLQYRWYAAPGLPAPWSWLVLQGGHSQDV